MNDTIPFSGPVYEFDANIEANYLTSSNVVMILMFVGILVFSFMLFFVIFKLSEYVDIGKFFIVSLIGFIILSLPPFLRNNLFYTSWPPQLDFPDFYFEKIPIIISLLYLTSLATFIRFFYNRSEMSKSDRVGLFIPFHNLVIIAKHISFNAKTVKDRIIIVLFFIVLTCHFYYQLLAPFLFFFGMDSYNWYFDMLYGESGFERDFFPYALLTDYIIFTKGTVPFVAAVFTIPMYFVLNKLNHD